MSDRPTKKAKTAPVSAGPKQPRSSYIRREERWWQKMQKDRMNAESLPFEEKGYDRPDKVDFTIVVHEKSVKTRYGVEKSSLALNSTFFKKMFDEEKNKKTKTQEFHLSGFTKDVAYKALQILSGFFDKDSWTINESVDLIEFGKMYPCDIIINCGLQKFCHAFADEALSKSQAFTSRYGRAALVKFISLWREMLQDELVCSTETSTMFLWCIRNVWYSWCKKCDTTLEQARITHFITLDTPSYLSAYDICLASEYIEQIRNEPSFSRNLGELLNTDGDSSSDLSGEGTQALS